MDEPSAENPLEPIVPKDSPPTAFPTPPPLAKHNGPYTLEQRKQAMEAFLKSSMTAKDFARVWGISERSFGIWVQRYNEEGPKGLVAHKTGPSGRPRRPGMREEITQVKQRFPDFGLRKVRDFLFRHEGIKVSTGSVRNTLREKGLHSTRRYRKREKTQPPRRFERAKPGELWQSDITSFVLARRSQRVYLTVFLDDYSRYIVSWGLYLHQKQDIVIETLLDGIERFGKPKEVLTDQGRQYFAWRGKGDFQRLLVREGIQHVVARTHHPQTVGKTERFWATVGEEFWERIQPQDFTEAKERFGHFVAHYNHYRPHQGIDGMTPADRFFGVESQVRQALEATLSRNELHLALGEKPRKPVFLVGQIGDQQVSLHGERGRLVFQSQDGNLQEMGLEGLGAPGGKNGDPSEQSRISSAAGAEEAQGADQKPEVQTAPEGAQTDEIALGLGQPGGEAESAPSGGSHPGELVGADHPGRDRQETGNTAGEGMADVPTGVGGAGGGAVETAQSPQGESAGLAAGGGSGEAQETDRGPGEGLGDDEGVVRAAQGIPGPSGGESGS